ncbi:hypothetical protein HDZ31DRAFT_32949, partial [Schizophyllum fasciatum]
RAERARRRARPHRREAEDSYSPLPRGRSRSPSRYRADRYESNSRESGGVPQDLPPPPSVFIAPASSIDIPPARSRPAESVAYSTGDPFSAAPSSPSSPVYAPPPPPAPYYNPLPAQATPYPSTVHVPLQAAHSYGQPVTYIPADYGPQQYQTTSSKFGDNVLGVLCTFLTYRLPQFFYQTLLFRMPVFYYGRVSRVLEDAEMSLADVRKLAMTTASEWKTKDKKQQEEMLDRLDHMTNWNYASQYASQVTPAMRRFRESWESFVDSLIREWKTQNIISALLLSALLTMLQIDVAASDVVTRTACVLALIAALMSLLYGCLYIIRFGTMKRMHKASAWADEAQKRREAILWNVWVLLAMPVVWLAWSIILFIVSIMSYVWRTNSVSDPEDRTTSKSAALGTRIAITCLLGLGVIYLAAMAKTFARYGDQMDKAWKRQITTMVQQILPDGTTVNAYGQPTENPSRPSLLSQAYPPSSAAQWPPPASAVQPQTPYTQVFVAPPPGDATPYSRPAGLSQTMPPYATYPGPPIPGHLAPVQPIYDARRWEKAPSQHVAIPPMYSPIIPHAPSTARTSTNTVRTDSSSRRPSRRPSYATPSVAEMPLSPPRQPASAMSTSQPATQSSEPRSKSSKRPNVRLGYPAQAIPDPPSPPSPLPFVAAANWLAPAPYTILQPPSPFVPQQYSPTWPQKGQTTMPHIPPAPPPPAPVVTSYVPNQAHSTEAGYEGSPGGYRADSRSTSPRRRSSSPAGFVSIDSRRPTSRRRFTRRGPFTGFNPRQVIDISAGERLEDDPLLFGTVFAERDVAIDDYREFIDAVIRMHSFAGRAPESESPRASRRGRERTLRVSHEQDAVFEELRLWNDVFFRQRGMSAVLAYEKRREAEDGYAVYLVNTANTLLEDAEELRDIFSRSIAMHSMERTFIYLFDSGPPSAFREQVLINADIVIDMENMRGGGSPSRRTRRSPSPPRSGDRAPFPESPRAPREVRGSESSSDSSGRRETRALSTIDEESRSRIASLHSAPDLAA